jgi:ABC-type nitrate/sulfonate/bicarbonate transport system substrate-binding protein
LGAGRLLLRRPEKGPRVYSSPADRRRFVQAGPAPSAVMALTVLLLVACTPETDAPPPPTQAAASSTASPLSAAAGAPSVSGPATKVRVSYPEGGAHLPLFYARDKGIFAKNGLDVALVGLGGGPVAAAALQSGEIQIVDITGSEVVSADAAGADIIILATLTPVYPYVFEVSPAIPSKDDLKGKTIAVRASGDATDIATRVLLKREGLDPDKDVTILAVQQEGARMASLMAGQICCTVAQVQDRVLLEQNNFHMLFDMTTLGIRNAQGVIATRRAYAKDHPDVIQRFMDSLIESIARSKNDRAGSLPVLKAQLKLEDDAIVAAIYDFFIGEVVPNVPTPTAAQFADGISILSRQNEKVRGFDVAPFIDTSYLDNSLERGLDKSQ